ncbi:MAG: hypothetical protein KAQ98_07205 [Bacteriovoracaceae bacterium]|nr:hypothetical protein [Bacteriovoracaceae bacterium]
MLRKHLKNIGKKIVSCPSCGQKLRLPVRPGKILNVRCSKCQIYFNISFKTPLSSIFGNKLLTPKRIKWGMYAALILLLLFVLNYYQVHDDTDNIPFKESKLFMQ